nr:hypothetical protein Ade03nite_94560 [Actinoplanes derwentensis]
MLREPSPRKPRITVGAVGGPRRGGSLLEALQTYLLEYGDSVRTLRIVLASAALVAGRVLIVSPGTIVRWIRGMPAWWCGMLMAG